MIRDEQLGACDWCAPGIDARHVRAGAVPTITTARGALATRRPAAVAVASRQVRRAAGARTGWRAFWLAARIVAGSIAVVGGTGWLLGVYEVGLSLLLRALVVAALLAGVALLVLGLLARDGRRGHCPGAWHR